MAQQSTWDESTTAGAAELTGTIVEQLVDGVVVVDDQGIVRFANAAALRLFGRDRAELAGEPLGYPIVVGESAEVELFRAGSDAVLVELRAAEVPWAGGTARLVSLRDVTERRHAERRVAELERQRVEAEAGNRAKAEFLAVMSHELRTPLNAILGYAELLDIGVHGELVPQQRQHVERVRSSAKHLLSLVNDVLDLSKIEAGRLTVLDSRSSLSETATAAIELVRPVAAARDIALEYRCDPTAGEYRGDESRVRQILVNLLQNAIKFTPREGCVRLECGRASVAPVEARLPRGGQYTFYRVIDTGEGIPASRLSAIFDPFVQVDGGHTRRNDGSGLGLSISRRLARRMEGDITVSSTPGKGSCFTLWLMQATDAPCDTDECRAAEREKRRSAGGEDGTGAPTGGAAGTSDSSPAIADVGEVILQSSATIVGSLVARLRHERSAGVPEGLRYADLANHFVSFVAILAETLMTRAEPGTTNLRLIEEDLEMLQLLADHHGEQRARLKFELAGLEREWMILQEEVERIIAEHASQLQANAIAEARAFIQRAVVRAEGRSRAAYRSVVSGNGGEGEQAPEM